ncbi:MAG: type II secretion system F family protein [marine benthic group bacterium]|jgi:tight adherence protein C|nr:type II secretion system F family protein [Candidatus Benthicola marisminoris]
MVTIVAVLIAITAILGVVAVAELVPARERSVGKRLQELQDIRTHRGIAHQRQRQAKREQLESWLQNFGERVASGRKDLFETRQRLIRAGYRGQDAVPIYYSLRVLCLVVGAVIILGLLPTLQGSDMLLWIVLGGAAAWMLPSGVLRRKIRLRQKEMQKALPDALDMLVICVEAGLGLNQALVRVADEVENMSPVLSEELQIVNLEMRAGTPREDALRNLGERTDLPDLRSLATMLIQTDRFGTSIAQALRVHSDTLRTKRRQRAEEAAAKTTIKLVPPLVFFIFPAIFVVVLGPAMLHLIQELGGI